LERGPGSVLIYILVFLSPELVEATVQGRIELTAMCLTELDLTGLVF
jgi:hypothetical protein